ncbi:MAG: hypothetical protein AUG51_17735 [Acidobacteria bacterium 13_1_20CM_3_53_8]|nr:MAG: hypothetical protein AUG51_17735 [Acidobacteria bacterium 13_1_20CM_3_53_8]
MNEVERILDQLKRAFEGNAWHGPAVEEVLADVTAEQAAAKPIPDAHSIWELTLHIAAWESAGTRRLRGDRAQLTPEEDYPPVTDTSEAAWQETRNHLERTHEEFQQEISKLQDSQLDEPVLESMSSVYRTLHGIIQHDLYHAGQIAILKKAF